jgi:flagellar biosynthesis component FlhA
MAVPEKAEAKSSTDKILKQILDVAEQSLEISKQLLATAQSSNDFLARITEVVEGFAHNYSVSVEQVVITKPKPQPTPTPKR